VNRLSSCRDTERRTVRQAICMSLTTEAFPPLFEPQLTRISNLALGFEGYEEAQIASGIVFYRQGWWCRVR
jgi:hypothetical protein